MHNFDKMPLEGADEKTRSERKKRNKKAVLCVALIVSMLAVGTGAAVLRPWSEGAPEYEGNLTDGIFGESTLVSLDLGPAARAVVNNKAESEKDDAGTDAAANGEGSEGAVAPTAEVGAVTPSSNGIAAADADGAPAAPEPQGLSGGSQPSSGSSGERVGGDTKTETPPPAPKPDPPVVTPPAPTKNWVYGYKCGSCDFHSTSVAAMDEHQRSQALAGADHGAYGSWSWEE